MATKKSPKPTKTRKTTKPGQIRSLTSTAVLDIIVQPGFTDQLLVLPAVEGGGKTGRIRLEVVKGGKICVQLPKGTVAADSSSAETTDCGSSPFRIINGDDPWTITLDRAKGKTRKRRK